MAESQTYYAPSGDPIRCWTFDNVSGLTVYDEMGNGNATIGDTDRNEIQSGGRVDNCLAQVAEGNFHKALQIATISTWKSISMWAKFPVAGTKTYYFGTNSSDTNYFLQRNSDNEIKHSSRTAVLETIDDTDWHHYAIVFPNNANNGTNEWDLYIDGELVHEGTDGVGGDLLFFGGWVNVNHHQSPSMDVIQVYDYALDAEDVEALYLLGHFELLESWRELYHIGLFYTELFSEPYYNVSDYVTTGYTEPMAYTLLASFREPYRSTPQHLAFWREFYTAAPEYVRAFVEPYISAAEILATWREEWTEQPAILAAWVEPYRVADAALLVSITEPYSLEELSQLMPYWREQYAMTIGTSLYQRVERVH